jgi:hypothetical protein
MVLLGLSPGYSPPEDDLTLALDFLGVEGGAEGHVGEGLDGRLERIRGHHDVEVGVVEGGSGVGPATHPFHRAIDVARSPLVRALEEHVLLEVREAELIRLLVAHADAHVEIHGHDVGGTAVLTMRRAVREYLADGPRVAREQAGAGAAGARRPSPVAARPCAGPPPAMARCAPTRKQRRGDEAIEAARIGCEPPPTDARRHTGIAAPEIIPARSDAR